MFDDQPTGVVPPAGQVPNNLPFSEPVDVFENTDSAPIVEPPSALEAGILRPKEEYTPTPAVEEAPSLDVTPAPVSAPTSISAPTPSYSTMPQDPSLQAPAEAPMYTVKEPTLSRGIMTAIIIIVAICIFGGGGWWIYKVFVVPSESSDTKILQDQNSVLVPPVVDVDTETQDTQATNPLEENTGQLNDNQILFGQPLDTDNDGLSDDDEIVRGTDIENWDTDNDALGDGDEVIIWDTDPKNADTDGDTYLDGAEVKAGYSPNGPGRMFEPPTTTTADSPVTTTSIVTPTSTTP